MQHYPLLKILTLEAGGNLRSAFSGIDSFLDSLRWCELVLREGILILAFSRSTCSMAGLWKSLAGYLPLCVSAPVGKLQQTESHHRMGLEVNLRVQVVPKPCHGQECLPLERPKQTALAVILSATETPPGPLSLASSHSPRAGDSWWCPHTRTSAANSS